MTTAQTAAPALGTQLPAREVGPITKTHIVRYAGASGDFNLVHHDDEFARAAGYPGVFSIGMLQAGILAGYATEHLGADNIRRFQVRFREQVWPGDVLTCTGLVTGVWPEPSGGERVTLDLTCTRQTGGVALAGIAEFVLDGPTQITIKPSAVA